MPFNDTIEKRKIFYETSDPPIKDLIDRKTENRLFVTKFQRHYVWENRPVLKSKLIESVLLKVPIPVIYTAETDDGNEEVVDGQQRITTFHDFYFNKFKLTGLELLSDLNGKSYQDLPEKPIDLKHVFKTQSIRVIKIQKESDPDMKFDIFERLNRGSVKLNEQELRNCIYRGNFNDLLKELAEDNDTFLRLQNLTKPHGRMVDVERILRFFAFCDKTEHNYKSPLKKFLNAYIREKQNISEEEQHRKETLFKKCVELCSTVFGNMAFKRWRKPDQSNPNGVGDSTINEGIMDVQMFGFMEYEKRDIVPKSQTLRDAFIDLVCTPEFAETIEIGTYDTDRVKKRTEKWFAKLREVVGYSEHDRRLYAYEEKVQLFKRENGDICQICKNRIASIDDAHVDHIERFIDGGKTIIKNAQLTHRYCNLSKG